METSQQNLVQKSINKQAANSALNKKTSLSITKAKQKTEQNMTKIKSKTAFNKPTQGNLYQTSPSQSTKKAKTQIIKDANKKKKFTLGTKIKDIEINKKSYRSFSAIIMLISNLMLLAVLIVMLSLVHNGWICSVFIFLYVLCLAWSVCQIYKAKYQKIYTLYDNCLVVKSVVTYAIIKFEDVYDIEPCMSLRDKVHKTAAHGLAFYLSPNHKNKIIIGFIDEDLTALASQIKTLVEQSKQKN